MYPFHKTALSGKTHKQQHMKTKFFLFMSVLAIAFCASCKTHAPCAAYPQNNR
ncbi:MAG: hypothetical protein K0S33_3789 [Bacteroidetes bacterium]|jgi:hypothetical protein|nr:hypothetical protein [Bacteroidota bacterium]